MNGFFLIFNIFFCQVKSILVGKFGKQVFRGTSGGAAPGVVLRDPNQSTGGAAQPTFFAEVEQEREDVDPSVASSSITGYNYHGANTSGAGSAGVVPFPVFTEEDLVLFDDDGFSDRLSCFSRSVRNTPRSTASTPSHNTRRRRILALSGDNRHHGTTQYDRSDVVGNNRGEPPKWDAGGPTSASKGPSRGRRHSISSSHDVTPSSSRVDHSSRGGPRPGACSGGKKLRRSASASGLSSRSGTSGAAGRTQHLSSSRGLDRMRGQSADDCSDLRLVSQGEEDSSPKQPPGGGAAWGTTSHKRTARSSQRASVEDSFEFAAVLAQHADAPAEQETLDEERGNNNNIVQRTMSGRGVSQVEYLQNLLSHQADQMARLQQERERQNSEMGELRESLSQSREWAKGDGDCVAGGAVLVGGGGVAGIMMERQGGGLLSGEDSCSSERVDPLAKTDRTGTAVEASGRTRLTSDTLRELFNNRKNVFGRRASAPGGAPPVPAAPRRLESLSSAEQMDPVHQFGSLVVEAEAPSVSVQQRRVLIDENNNSYYERSALSSALPSAANSAAVTPAAQTGTTPQSPTGTTPAGLCGVVPVKGRSHVPGGRGTAVQSFPEQQVAHQEERAVSEEDTTATATEVSVQYLRNSADRYAATLESKVNNAPSTSCGLASGNNQHNSSSNSSNFGAVVGPSSPPSESPPAAGAGGETTSVGGTTNYSNRGAATSFKPTDRGAHGGPPSNWASGLGYARAYNRRNSSKTQDAFNVVQKSQPCFSGKPKAHGETAEERRARLLRHLQLGEELDKENEKPNCGGSRTGGGTRSSTGLVTEEVVGGDRAAKLPPTSGCSSRSKGEVVEQGGRGNGDGECGALGGGGGGGGACPSETEPAGERKGAGSLGKKWYESFEKKETETLRDALMARRDALNS